MFCWGISSVNGSIVTADVAVSSPGGQYEVLAIGELVSTNWDRYYWHELPAFAVEQDVLFWQYEHTGFPNPADGLTTFEVLNDGPVLMACTTRWGLGGGGNIYESWYPEITTRAELESQGWTEFTTGLKDAELGGPAPCVEYVIFRRDCVAGEEFTYRTEKYRPPMIIRSINTVPEPSTLAIFAVGTAMAMAFSRKRSNGFQ